MFGRGQRLLAMVAAATTVLTVGTAAAHLEQPRPDKPIRIRAEAVPVTPTPSPAPTPTATPAPPRPAAPDNPLQRRIAAELAAAPSSCVVVEEAGRVVGSYRGSNPVIPASTQKILVAAAALNTLGPEHRFVTRAFGDGPVQGGIVDRLYLVGSGDPQLGDSQYASYLASAPRWNRMRPTSLSALADQLVAGGLKEVRREVVGDDSRHHPERYMPFWKPSFLASGTMSQMSALTVNSGWSRWKPSRQAAAVDPRLHGASVLTELLKARGVKVRHPAGAAKTPPSAALLGEVRSAPLRESVAGMLYASDNVSAEALTREVGLALRGIGETRNGVTAVRDSLQQLGVDVRATKLADGSGLAQANRTSCRALVDTLRARPGGLKIQDLLAIAGQSGTLWTRFRGTPLQHNLRGKTGWISGVVGLTGTLNLGRPMNYAIVVNGVPSQADGIAIVDRVVHAIAERSSGRLG